MNGALRGEEELRLIYSAVVVRAVNGLTGHEQKVQKTRQHFYLRGRVYISM